MEQDIRWKQRFNNYEKALKQLSSAIETHGKNPADIIKEGIIQRFEFTHELSWKLMRDFLQLEGIVGIMGSRSAVREAFNKDLITDGQVWMDMIESRNRTVHTYKEDVLKEEFDKIINVYLPLFVTFRDKMKNLL